VSELALAAFAAHTDSHLVSAPRSERFARFRGEFDERAYLAGLAQRGLRWLPRSSRDFPRALAAIFDPPPGLFVRGRGEFDLLERPAVAIVGARSCSSYGAEVARMLGRELAAAGLDDPAAEAGRFHFAALHQRRRSGGRPESSSARAAIASANLLRLAAATRVPFVAAANTVGRNGITVRGWSPRT